MLRGKDVLIWGNKMIIKMFSFAQAGTPTGDRQHTILVTKFRARNMICVSMASYSHPEKDQICCLHKPMDVKLL